jgi:L-rhamnose mutarotase
MVTVRLKRVNGTQGPKITRVNPVLVTVDTFLSASLWSAPQRLMKRFIVLEAVALENCPAPPQCDRLPRGRTRVVPRVCFTLQVRPDRLDEYRRRHAAVRPEMLTALRDAGWQDYQLFLREDGLLVGTLVTDDLDAAQAAMEKTSINSIWQADMAPFFDLPDGRPDRGMHVLDLVFDLDAQLATAGDDARHERQAPIGESL